MPGDSRRGRTGEDRRVLLVGDLLRAVEDQFRIAFPRRLWVLGVVRGLQNQDPLEFLLTEVDDAGHRLTLPAELGENAAEGIDTTLRRLHDVAVGDLLVDGHLVRAGGLLSYDTDRHIMIFSVTALDPEPTRAWLADRRDGLRDAAHAARLGDRQRDVRVPLAPTSVGLVGSTADSGLAQARHRLAEEDFAIDLVEYPVTVVGAEASDALATAVRQASAAQHDVVLLVREGGRPLALAAFDAEQVVRSVAEAGVPVIAGLGSDEEPTAVDEVAHETVGSPDDAAEAVLRRLRRASELVEQAAETLHLTGDEALRRAARRVEEKRAEIAGTARRARARAERAKARRTRAIRLAAALLAVLVVVLAVVVTPWLAVLLVVPLAVALFAERLRPRRRSSPMALETLSFSAALQRLGDVQRELDEAADPDDVERLEARAAELADHCRSLLRRPRPLRDGRPAAVGTFQRGSEGRRGDARTGRLDDDREIGRDDDDQQGGGWASQDAADRDAADRQPAGRGTLGSSMDAHDGDPVDEQRDHHQPQDQHQPEDQHQPDEQEQDEDQDRTQAIRLPSGGARGVPSAPPAEIDLRDRPDASTEAIPHLAPASPEDAQTQEHARPSRSDPGPGTADVSGATPGHHDVDDAASEDTVAVPSDARPTEQLSRSSAPAAPATEATGDETTVLERPGRREPARPQATAPEDGPTVTPPPAGTPSGATSDLPATTPPGHRGTGAGLDASSAEDSQVGEQGDEEPTVRTASTSPRPGARRRTRARRPTGAAATEGDTDNDPAPGAQA